MCLGSGVAELPGGIRLRILDITDITMIRSQPGIRCVSPVADLASRKLNTSSRFAGFVAVVFVETFFFNLNHVKTAAS